MKLWLAFSGSLCWWNGSAWAWRTGGEVPGEYQLEGMAFRVALVLGVHDLVASLDPRK